MESCALQQRKLPAPGRLGIGLEIRRQARFAQADAAAMNSLSDVSSKILQKSLNISPTLQVRPGMTFNVLVNRSIILPTYR